MTRLPTWLRAAIITGGQTFLGALSALALAALADVSGWINGGAIPDLAVYAKLLASAAIAFVTFVVTAIWRRVKPPEQTYIDTTAGDITGRQQATPSPAVHDIAVELRQDLQAYIDDYGWAGVRNALELLRPGS